MAVNKILAIADRKSYLFNLVLITETSQVVFLIALVQRSALLYAQRAFAWRLFIRRRFDLGPVGSSFQREDLNVGAMQADEWVWCVDTTSLGYRNKFCEQLTRVRH